METAIRVSEAAPFLADGVIGRLQNTRGPRGGGRCVMKSESLSPRSPACARFCCCST